jgi:TrmH family RNA methyltransferase
MLRTADAAGLSGVIIADPATDIYNPNVVRSSIGCLFTVPVAVSKNDEVLNWCKTNGLKTYATSLEASVNYTSIDFRNACAIVLGAESTGLSKFWITNSDQKIIIPMRGKIDSMNVSNAAAIIIFEALRQRN